MPAASVSNNTATSTAPDAESTNNLSNYDELTTEPSQKEAQSVASHSVDLRSKGSMDADSELLESHSSSEAAPDTADALQYSTRSVPVQAQAHRAQSTPMSAASGCDNATTSMVHRATRADDPSNSDELTTELRQGEAQSAASHSVDLRSKDTMNVDSEPLESHSSSDAAPDTADALQYSTRSCLLRQAALPHLDSVSVNTMPDINDGRCHIYMTIVNLDDLYYVTGATEDGEAAADDPDGA